MVLGHERTKCFLGAWTIVKGPVVALLRLVFEIISGPVPVYGTPANSCPPADTALEAASCGYADTALDRSAIKKVISTAINLELALEAMKAPPWH